ncbi:MAG: L,D-transpeptidase family protein [Candidatus Kappaea frigidicola]|nr:L,D-transpeptidase family protein [Candidatus Kappaea frigidicola]
MKRVFISILVAVLVLTLFIVFITSKRNAGSFERQLQQARLLVSNGDIKVAEDFYNELISVYKNDHIVVEAFVDLAEVYQSTGQMLKAKDIYQKVISEYPDSQQAAIIQEKLWNLNIDILFSGLIADNNQIYEVQPKDTLNSIAKKFLTTVDLLQKSNNLDDAFIRPGDRLKVVNAEFGIIIDKSQNTLILKEADNVIRIYNVSTGKNNCTPVGEFTIDNKLKNPVHYKKGEIVPAESPDNVLGSRWMGLSIPTYGIHGTIDEATLGQQITEGCVRMRNNEVEELYIIVPVGTKVTIVD